MQTKQCSRCGEIKPVSEFRPQPGRLYGVRSQCKICNRESRNESRYRRGERRPLGTNRDCPSYLGIHIAERVLAGVFESVERMSMNNPGFDFICGRGYKIDVKSATPPKNKPGRWQFRIAKNRIAEYFLMLAFDNRCDLNPMHVWMIPSTQVNHLMFTSISKSTLSKWKSWELSLEKIVACCDIMRRGPSG